MISVSVVMSTYNGEKYLADQIESILGQKSVIVELYVYDDLSQDSTVNILENLSKIHNNIHYTVNAKRLGAKQSFLQGLQNAGNADYYAFSDQDDIWDDDKLIEGVNKLQAGNKSDYQLYFSSARIVDSKLDCVGIDSFDHRILSFGEVITRNNGIGCTFIFNNKLKTALDMVPVSKLGEYPLHDQWVYAVCSSLNGSIIFDSNSHIQYRQHESNEVGGKKRSIMEKVAQSGLFVKKDTRMSLVHDLNYYFGSMMTDENYLLIKRLVNYEANLRNKVKAAVIIESQMHSTISKIEIGILLMINHF